MGVVSNSLRFDELLMSSWVSLTK